MLDGAIKNFIIIKTWTHFKRIFTLCIYLYVQQDYVFGRFVYIATMYVCNYAYMYVLCGQQKRAVWGLTTEKSPISVIYCLLVEFKG